MYISGVAHVAILIDDFEHLSSRIAPRLTKVFVHVLPVGDSTQKGKPNCLCAYEACCNVDNNNVKIRLMSTVYIVPMCLFEVLFESIQVLEHPKVVVVFIFLRSERFLAVGLLRCVDILVSAVLKFSL